VQRFESILCASALGLLAASMAGCGGKDICLGCTQGTPTPGGGSFVTVEGNILSSPGFAKGDFVEIICVGLSTGTIDQCGDAGVGGTKFVANTDNAGNFEITGVDPGSERVGFWIDKNRDGVVDPDEVLELADPDRQLQNLSAGDMVRIADADVDFSRSQATAAITVNTSTPTPAPSGTPSGTPTPNGASTQ
jgi:hypothetical protein